MSPATIRLPALLLLLTAALCSHQASTRAWGEGLGTDGTRFRLFPNGISHRAADGSALASCRWFPLHGTDPLCQAAAGAESRFQRLTYAYPSLQGGAWLSFLAMLILTLAGPQASTLIRSLTAIGTLATILGTLLVFGSAPTAVAALAGLTFRFGGPGLVMGLVSAAAAAAAALLIPSAPPRGS
jgi:hypothetical protein